MVKWLTASGRCRASRPRGRLHETADAPRLIPGARFSARVLSRAVPRRMLGSAASRQADPTATPRESIEVVGVVCNPPTSGDAVQLSGGAR
jgi:hypothetical protein